MSDKNTDSLEEQLKSCRKELEFYKKVVEMLPNAIFLKDEELKFKFFSKEYARMFGTNTDNLLGKYVEDLEYLSPESRKRYAREDRNAVDNQGHIHYTTQMRLADNTDHDTLYWVQGFETNSGVRGLVGEIVDISEETCIKRKLESHIRLLSEANKQIEIMSKKDPLTKLYNRVVLDEAFNSLISDTDSYFSALLLDLDNFKDINDEFGHLAGDEVLKSFAHIIQSNLRKCDVAIRYGGEEFFILLPKTDINGAKIIAERIRKNTQNELSNFYGGGVTVSIGATESIKTDNINNLIKRVDKAMYAAKKNGKNQICVG